MNKLILIPLLIGFSLFSTTFAQQTISGSFSSGGQTRSYIGAVPNNPQTPLRLVVLFCGATENAAQMELRGFNKHLGSNTVVIYPEPYSTSGFDNSNGVDDYQMVEDLIADVASNYSINLNDICIGGFSNGAIFTYNLVCDFNSPTSTRAYTFKSFAVVAGAMEDGQANITDCPIANDLPVIAFHGTQDPIVPYSGGAVPAPVNISSEAIEPTLDFWATTINGCNANPTVIPLPDLVTETPTPSTVELLEYDCQTSQNTQLYRIDGGLHSWPGGNAAFDIGQSRNMDINASELIANFFEDQTAGQCSPTSSAFAPQGLPQGFDSTALTIESIQLPFPTLIEVVDSNEVYVFGGQPVALDIFVNAIITGQPSQPNPAYYSQFTPYVVQVDPVTMDTMFLELSGGPGIPYLGGIAKHPNGYLYAIAQAKLFKIDPADMSILTTIDMPVQAGLPLIYNGVFITNSGLLVTKSTDLANPGQGAFFMLDPDSLQILNQIALDAGTARLALDCDSLGNEYIYHINQEYTFRMLVVNDSLVVDTSWQAAYDPYGTGVNAEPTSPRLLNDIVAYTTNTSFDATEPMKIFWQRTGQSYSRDTDTLRGEFMFSDTLSAGFDFFGLIMNEETEVILGQDQANGKIAAYRINDADELTYLWEKEYAVCGAPYIVGSTGMVYTNHYDAVEETTYLIILDLFTGNELGRVQTPATRPSISQTRVGAYNDFYYCSNEAGQSLGYFHRVSLGETATTSTTNLILANEIQVAPNPFENQTLVTWKNRGNAIFQAQLLNVAGQTVRTYQDLRGESFLIKKEGLESGIYFLHVVDDAGHSGMLKLSLL